ncbi:MAG TPA: MGMT family protein [Panacibacter sp.]|nr:MGMT family protein [Panacibacter sp.]HNP46854.1 MGMT family protein [Panacibacter sp.]
MKKPAPAKKVSSKLPVNDQTKTFSFFENVWDVVRQVPRGRVTSYGAIANYLGTGLSARMVGWAMNAASQARPKVPAQRVVNRNGMLSGKAHFKTPDEMEALLKKDGVAVEKDQVVDFAQRYWDPAKELGI